MSEVAERYRRLAGAFTDKVAGVAPPAWSNPTPCEKWNARELVAHVVSIQELFEGFVGRSIEGVPAAEDGPMAAWTVARDAVQADLDDPDRATAGFDGYFGPTTFEASVDRFVRFDLVVHGWDLARATGQDERIDAIDLLWLAEVTAGFGDSLYQGVCAPALDSPPGADEQTRLLARLGRRAW